MRYHPAGFSVKPAMGSKRFHVIGLTGGIASGKSQVAALLRARDVPVVDADQLARDVVQPGEAALAAIVSAFGPGVLAPDGTLDRRALGRLVFGDPEARARLEAITHPAIAARSLQAFATLQAQGHALVFYEAALLVETGGHRQLSALVVVSAPKEVQRARLLAREPDLTAAEADARIASQLPLSEKEAVADVVVRNDADLVTLASRVDDMLARLTRGLDG